WKNEKKAEKLVEIVAEKMSISVDKAYDMFGNMLLEDYESLYDSFESAVADTDAFLEDYEGEWLETFMEVARENVAAPSVQIDGILEMTSPAPNGMELVRNALLKGVAAADGADAEITCVGCPRYRVVVRAPEYKEAEEIMKEISNAAIGDLVANGGTASLKRESR
ncbi:MAG: translation initiation factor IF-2 subunit alpha, partial [Thermoplasmata archaeon]|nr:translation initiation factor IF-2 subunit alpha [Thermoplasmata archaeon]